MSTHPKAGITEEFKDMEGHVVLKRVWETDIKSLSTYYVYDDLGNLRYVLPPAVNENTERSAGTISSFTETDGVFRDFIYGYHYDGRNRVTEKKIPGKGWEYLVYNKLDQVIFTQDAKQRSTYEWVFTKYDALGRVIMTGIYLDDAQRAIFQTNLNAQSYPLFEGRDIGSAVGTGYTNNAYPNVGVSTYLTINYYDDYNFQGNTFGPPVSPQVGNDHTKTLLTGTRTTILGTGTMLLSVNYYDRDGRVIQSKSVNHLGGSDVVDNEWNFDGSLKNSTRVHVGNGATTTIANSYAYDHVGRKKRTKSSINGGTQVTLSSLTYNEIGQLISKDQHSTDDVNFAQHTGFTFNYTYDRLNRLTVSSAGNSLGESISYDVMGNIKALNRDNFATNDYHIDQYKGNQLKTISGFTNGSYTYNENGNQVVDGPNGNTISYNYLNLPVQVSGNQNVTYTYDAGGRKLKKVSASTGTTDYVEGIVYKSDGSIDFIQTEEGIARNSSGVYSYEYNQADHLGNVRTSFKKNPVSGLVEPIQRDDYYAFGLRKVASGGTNKYLYNGKELQEELGQYDYGARFYDPVIGRWNVVDPLADGRAEMTPYHFVSNNPINRIDPDGRWDWYQSNVTGTVKWFDGTGEQDGYRHVGEAGAVKSSDGGIVNLNANGTATNSETGEEVTSSTSGLTSIVPKDQTGALAKFFYDVLSGGAYSRQANALDVLDRDGIGAYNNQMIADARTEIRGDWMVGAYHGASVSAPKAATGGGRVFWSGGEDAMNAAANYAKVNGMTTLEMTRAGQNLTKLTQGMPWEKAGPMWQRLSSAYAKGATGSVHVFQNASTGVRLNSVWRTVEYPLLNGKNNLIFHNVFKP